jgi:hypothetical protein
MIHDILAVAGYSMQHAGYRRRQQLPQKVWYLSFKLDGITSQQKAIGRVMIIDTNLLLIWEHSIEYTRCVTPCKMLMVVDESGYGDSELKFQHLSTMVFQRCWFNYT